LLGGYFYSNGMAKIDESLRQVINEEQWISMELVAQTYDIYSALISSIKENTGYLPCDIVGAKYKVGECVCKNVFSTTIRIEYYYYNFIGGNISQTKSFIMAKVIRYNVRNETHSGDNVFLIHRPFIFSNPFTHIKDKKTKAKYIVGSREEAIELYADYFDAMLDTSLKFNEEWEKLYCAYNNYDEIYLGCYCGNNEPCHGDVIIEKLKRRSIKDMLHQLKNKRQEK
jgi:hypothetical protein